jgi:c-src tyrosine kinase
MASDNNGLWEPGTKCQAKYNFPGSTPHDLPFNKGEILTIIHPTKDPNWYKARRQDGMEGIIPFNYVTKYKQEDVVNPPPVLPTNFMAPPTTHNASSSYPNDKSLPKGAVKLHTMPWFHGKLTRDDVEKLLIPPKNGLFLVRESVAYKGDYTLSVCYDGKIEHYRVRRDDRNWVTVDDEEYFENLVALVEVSRVNDSFFIGTLWFVSYTVEPPNKGHFGTMCFVLC